MSDFLYHWIQPKDIAGIPLIKEELSTGGSVDFLPMLVLLASRAIYGVHESDEDICTKQSFFRTQRFQCKPGAAERFFGHVMYLISLSMVISCKHDKRQALL